MVRIIRLLFPMAVFAFIALFPVLLIAIFFYKFLRKICKSFFSCPNLIHEGSYPEPSADFQPIFGHKNKEDDPKVVFFLCFSLSPCNDYQLVAILYPNLIHYKSTRLYILGCKIGCLLCKTLIFNVYCGEDGIRTRGASCPARQFSKLLVSATHPPLRASAFFRKNRTQK